MSKISLIAMLVALPALGAAADGPKLYEQFCLKCHGAKGLGDGKSAKLFDPSPTNFTDAKWTSQKATDDQLLDVVKNGAKATKFKVGKKMPAFGKKMTDDEIKAVVKVVQGFSAGK